MTESVRILVVDDEETFGEVLRRELERRGHDTEAVASGEAALETLGERNFDVVLLDLMMPCLDGIETLRRIRERDVSAEVVMLTGQGTIASAVEAMRIGAHDYLTKPCEMDAVDAICRRAAEKAWLRRQNRLFRMNAEQEPRTLLGSAPAIEALRQRISRAAGADYPVLIVGESGTGKELVARAVHAQSARSSLPLVTVNCASLNASLLESELFGHERGAFTGALRAREGLFEAADCGTIFLDEIGDMGLDLQARLLRTVQFGEVRRVGSNRTKTVDVRIIAATNHDLDRALREKTFRDDLYYRLQTVVLSTVPLRGHAEDIPALAEHILAHAAERTGRSPKLSAGAMKVLQRYEWPGNVRELENLIQRLVILSDGDRIEEVDVVSAIHLEPGPGAAPALPDSLDEAERAHIARILADCSGKKPEAARRLGVSLKTLYNKLQKFGL